MHKVRLLLFFIATVAGFANSLVVYRSDKGLIFTEAHSLVINGKDKVLNLGAQPKINGQIGKLPSEKLGGMLIRDEASGVLASYARGEQPEYILPQGIAKNAAPDPAAIWKEARIAYKKTQSDKTPTEIPSTQFIAFLPDGAEDLSALCMDEPALNLLGGKQGGYQFQMELLPAVVRAYGTNPGMARVSNYVVERMRSALSDFDNGVNSAPSLDRGLKFAKLSAEAYAAEPQHAKLRKSLADQKGWLDRRLAILRALYAAGEWDAFMLGYTEFEKHQQSFPDMVEKRQKALAASLDEHWKTGKERLAESEYPSAYRELRIASFRQPTNTVLQKELSIAWTEYSRQIAIASSSNRKQLSVGQRVAMNQSLDFASRYKSEGKLDEALKSVLEGESIDAEALPVLLKKAEVLGARGELAKALATLEFYDKHAVDEDRDAGNKLRSELLFQLTNKSKELKTQMEAAWAKRSVFQVRRLAMQGLRADETDPDILYYAGISSLATRDHKQGREFLARFLDASNTVDADSNRRAGVLRMIPALGDFSQAEAGERNWFSGKKLGPGLMYCPISLAFQDKVERIEGSNHLLVKFTWDGDQLRSIVPSFEKPLQATGEKPIVFTYETRVPQVMSVRYEDAAAPAKTSDPDELLRQSNVLLNNNALIDPILLQRLTGQNAAIGVAGNRFFNPFVWQKLCFFRLKYDAAGRVTEARELAGDGQGGDTLVEFEWDGLKLSDIKAYQVSGADSKKALIYERRQQYQENRLVSEEIRTGGKVSRIKYSYNGGQLAMAECDKDESLDSRARKVFFAGAKSGRGR
jgi:hypothetical protein